MTDIIEKAARALYEARNDATRLVPEIAAKYPGYVDTFDQLHPVDQGRYRMEARAVLQSIREPSEAMVDAADPSDLGPSQYGKP